MAHPEPGDRAAEAGARQQGDPHRAAHQLRQAGRDEGALQALAEC